ncbi:hypothetical protein GUJ93_ZPchr0002g25149 [Zizania palustris]|uniref:Uncharacterized protein n=1 Tax=Zizania palustris TaxID=103762 RepID=A0A8J5VWR5_ZIZPA|nr:hypothetical protein GUJ93_ZPchr0002g25149 [Zizania palustris]
MWPRRPKNSTTMSAGDIGEAQGRSQPHEDLGSRVEVRFGASPVPGRKPAALCPSASYLEARSEAPRGQEPPKDDSEGDHTKAQKRIYEVSRWGTSSAKTRVRHLRCQIVLVGITGGW